MEKFMSKKAAYEEYWKIGIEFRSATVELRNKRLQGEKLASEVRQTPKQDRQIAIDACKAGLADIKKQEEEIKEMQRKMDELFAIWNA